MRRIIILLFCICSVIAQAQHQPQPRECRISGYIRDSATGETLSSATIIGDSTHAAVSNNYGYYSMAIPTGKATLQVMFLGYTTKHIPVDTRRDTTLNIALELSTQAIENVVVNSPKPSLVSYNNTGDVVVNMQQMKYAPLFFGERDIFKFLQLMPGVTSGREGATGLNIRGGTADQTLVMLDDVPVYNQSHAMGFVSIFSGESVKSAELYKSYISPSYGGRLSGVANLRLKDGNRYEHHQALTIGTLTASATLEGPLKKGVGSYLVSGRYFMPDLYMRAFYAIKDQGDMSRFIYGFYDITGKLSYDIGKHNTLFLNLYTGSDKFGTATADSEAKGDGSSKRRKISESYGGFGWRNAVASLRLNTKIASNIFMNNTLYYSLLTNQNTNDFSNLETGQEYNSRIRSTMNEFGWRTSLDHKVSSRYEVQYGINLIAQLFSPQKTDNNHNGLRSHSDYGKRDLYTAAAYVDNKYTFNRFTLRAGVRAALYDNDHKTLFAIEPRASVSMELDRKSSIWLAYTRNTQPLFSIIKSYFLMPIDFWVPFSGNSLQSSNQVVLGGKTTLWKRLNVSMEVYVKTMRNLAQVYDGDLFLARNQGYDIASGTAYGAEFSAQYQSGSLSATASYVYSRSTRKVGHESYPYMFDTPHNLSLFVSYDVLKRTNRRHTLSLTANYHTGMPYNLSLDLYPVVDGNYTWDRGVENFGVRPNMRMPDYFRADVSYNMERVKRTGVRNWQISILNLTNRRNPTMITRRQFDNGYKAVALIPIMPSFSYSRTF